MLRAGHAVILCALTLLTIGLVMVNSAGMSVRPLTEHATQVGELTGVTVGSILTSQAAVYMLAAVAVMALATRLPAPRLAKLCDPPATQVAHHPGDGLGVFFVGVGLVLLTMSLVYVPGMSHTVNGATRWVVLPGGFTFQPSELAKWTMPALLAWYVVRRTPMLGTFSLGLGPAAAALGLVAALIVKEDLGTGVLVGAAGCVVLLAGGCRLKQMAWFVPPVLLGLGLAVLTSPYRVKRIATFFNPFADPQGDGYHMLQSLATVAGGEGFGRGLGHGLQKFGYLPEDTTDFLYAVIAEELGIAGATLVISLYVGLLISLYTIARRQTSRAAQLFTLGVTATIGLQAVMNLFVVTGLGPTKGIALPLLSAGGTGWIMTGFSLGLVAALDLRQGRLPVQEIELKPVVREPVVVELKPIAETIDPGSAEKSADRSAA